MQDLKATDQHPTRRSVALTVVQSHTERAFCPWCDHRCVGVDLCGHPANRTSWGEYLRCRTRNGDGRCEHYTPSRWTRLLRWFGRRRPLLQKVKS